MEVSYTLKPRSTRLHLGEFYPISTLFQSFGLRDRDRDPKMALQIIEAGMCSESLEKTRLQNS